MLHANSIVGHFTNISLKVWKLRRERERSVSTAVSTADQTMTEPEEYSDLVEISAVMVILGVGQLPTDCSMRVFSHLYCRNTEPKV